MVAGDGRSGRADGPRPPPRNQPTEVQVCLLGPVEIVVDGARRSAGAPLQASVLAALAIRANETLTIAKLVDMLWGGSPPDRAGASLYTYIWSLRRLLGGGRIVSVAGGYRLDLLPQESDLGRFLGLVAQAEASVLPPRALELVEEALRLWRGAALAGAVGAGLDHDRERLQSLRARVAQRRARLLLQLGRADEGLEQLSALSDEEPFREDLVAELMSELAAAGRSAQALQIYDRLRRRLRTELGADPGAELQTLHARLLRAPEHAVVAESRTSDGPTARTVGLGVPLSRFVGRRAELAEVADLLQEHRLVTLLGIGGIGKTRLALEVAKAWRPRVDELLVVDFASLDTGDLVDGALLEAAGIGSQSSRNPLDTTVDHLLHRSALIVLDTCEPVLCSAAAAVERLVRHCPAVRVLATSRVRLEIPGEIAWPVPPLRTDPADTDSADTDLADAMALFVECARRARPGFRLDERTGDAATRIIHGVDGIPLAIELAAARLRVLTAEEIADGLTDHLRMLRGGAVNAARHRTMRASLEWSDHLLDAGLAGLFARLSVFAGGWTLGAAEAVCSNDQIPAADMLDAIAALVDRSLVIADCEGQTTRYRMLDFVRQYAREKLAVSPAADEVAVRHQTYYRDLAELADRELWAVRPGGRLRLDLEAPNFRQAITHASADGHVDALRLVAALALYWRERGRHNEGIRTIEDVLAHTPVVASVPRALALAGLGALSFWQGVFERTVSMATAAAAMAEQLGDARAHSNALVRLGVIALMSDPRTADHVLRQAAELARQANDQVAMCEALASLAIAYSAQDDRVRVDQFVEQVIAVAEPLGFDTAVRWCLWCSAAGALAAGEIDQARALAERAYGLPSQDPFGHMFAAEVLSRIDVVSGDPATARRRAETELQRSEQEAFRLGFGELTLVLAEAELTDGDLLEATQLAAKVYEQEHEADAWLAWRAQEVMMRAAIAARDPAAIRLHSQALTQAAQRLDNRRALAIAQTGLARAITLDGDLDQAESLAHDALEALAERQWQLDALCALDALSVIAASTDRPELATTLFAATEQQRRRLGIVRVPPEPDYWDAHKATLRQALGSERFHTVAMEGADMSLDETVAYARRSRRIGS
jgi:predicted ATPase/DNA-binding SARP family transcriptional activator